MSSSRSSQTAITITMPSSVQNPDFQYWRRKLAGILAGVRWRARVEDQTSQPIVLKQGLYRVLICRPNHGVDNLELLTPLIAELQLRFPGTQVDLIVAGSSTSDAFRLCPNVGQVYCLPHHVLRHPWKCLNVIRKFRQQRYDLAIDPDTRSMWARRLTHHCRATYRIGFSGTKTSARLTCSMAVPASTIPAGQAPVLLLRWALARSETLAVP